MSGFNKHWIYLGIRGQVLALDRATGTEMWRTKVKSGAVVNLASDDAFLYASAQGEVSCLDPGTGAILWKNPLSGLGLGLVSLVAPGGQNNNDVLLQGMRRQAQHQSAQG
jgi:outer membrane protein assembly factor BamB